MIAIKLKNARIPDNAGQHPVWEKIEPEGDDVLFSALPVNLSGKIFTEEEFPERFHILPGHMPVMK